MAPTLHTRLNSSAKASAGLVLAASALLLGLLITRSDSLAPAAGGGPGVSGNAPPVAVSDPLPPDVLALGTEVTPLAPEGMIPVDRARDVAIREFPFIQQGRIDAYLVAWTHPTEPGGLGAQDRPVWIIKASGAWDISAAPPLPDGTAADRELATRGYVYVDALTGEWLQAFFTGDPAN